MQRTIVFSSLLFILMTACQNEAALQNAGQFVEEVQKEFAPDKRVALFQAEVISKGNAVLLKGETNLPEAKAALLEKLNAAQLKLTDSLIVLPSAELKGRHWGVVSVSVGNIRSRPAHSAELATQALLGTPLRIWKKEAGFYLVQTPDDYLGWMDGGGFELMEESHWQKWMAAPKVICLEDYAFVYESPSESGQKVSDLLAGNILQNIGYQGNFIKTGLPDGREGFVKSSVLMDLPSWLETQKPDAGHILASAREMMGRPYLWGGTSGKGMDCSGFTKMAFYLNGIQLPRDASQQAMVGKLVESDADFSQLLPGDLLYFGQKAEGEKKERISHVAIYLGDGKIIHASERVQIQSLRRGDPDFAESRLNTYIRAKRVIGQEGRNGVISLKDSPYYVRATALQD